MNKLFGFLAGYSLIMTIIGTPDVMATPEKMHGKNSCIECHRFSKADAEKLFKDYRVTIESVRPHSSGLSYEIFFEAKDGGRKGVWNYVFSDKYFVGGALFDVKTQRPVFVHEDKIKAAQQKKQLKIDVESIPIKHAVTIGNPAGRKHLYVFTDPDCQNCRQLHSQLKQLAEIEHDVAIHIMLMPIQQLHPKAYDKARAILASPGKQILDDAFAGKAVPEVDKDGYTKEVDEIMSFAKNAKITEAPSIFLGNGTLYIGNHAADQIKEALK